MKALFKILFVISLINLFVTFDVFCQIDMFNQIELEGEWQNSAKFINFNFEQKKIIHELKTFYGLWRDKPFYTSFDELSVVPLVFNNELFLQYWVLDESLSKENKNATKLKLYLPKSNIDEISLDKTELYDEIYAYLFLNENEVIKIRYWLVNLDLTNDDFENQKAFITENTVNLSNNEPLSNLQDEYFRNIKKYIKIADKIYTCVEGKGVKIRNIEKIDFKEKFPNFRFFTKEKSSFLVLDKAYMKR